MLNKIKVWFTNLVMENDKFISQTFVDDKITHLCRVIHNQLKSNERNVYVYNAYISYYYESLVEECDKKRWHGT